MLKSKIVLSAAVVLFTTFAAAARDDGLASIDIQKRCNIRAKSSAEMMGDKSVTALAFDSCMRSEKEARAALVAAWKDIPPPYKTFCIRPNVYSPSYTEWIACIESNIDVKRLRSKN
jgi:hypothetical protein